MRGITDTTKWNCLCIRLALGFSFFFKTLSYVTLLIRSKNRSRRRSLNHQTIDVVPKNLDCRKTDEFDLKRQSPSIQLNGSRPN